MGRLRHQTLVLTLAISAGFLAACATTTMQSVNEAPDFQPAKIHKVMVVGLMRTPALRRKTHLKMSLYANGKYGVNAVSSLDVLPANVELNKAGVGQAAGRKGSTACL